MSRYRKKPIVVDAQQWWKNGDHSEDNRWMVYEGMPEAFQSEGKVVRYYRSPKIPGGTICRTCAKIMHFHGWVDTLEGGHIVCPGDWIITGILGEHYPCKPDIFLATYDLDETNEAAEARQAEGG